MKNRPKRIWPGKLPYNADDKQLVKDESDDDDIFDVGKLNENQMNEER